MSADWQGQKDDALEFPATWHAYAALGPMTVLGELLNELVQEGILPKERAARVLDRFDAVVAEWAAHSLKAAKLTEPGSRVSSADAWDLSRASCSSRSILPLPKGLKGPDTGLFEAA